jgi:hypothetical protein
VFSYEDEKMKGEPKIIATNRPEWDVKTILKTYLKRWKIDSFYRDAKQDCPVFIATHENDDNKRKRVSEAWSLALQEHFKPDDINCEGCLDGEKLFKYCSTCVVRECGLKKDIENCAYCTGYPCEKIEKLWRGFKTVSGEEAKANLDEIGKALRN